MNKGRTSTKAVAIAKTVKTTSFKFSPTVKPSRSKSSTSQKKSSQSLSKKQPKKSKPKVVLKRLQLNTNQAHAQKQTQTEIRILKTSQQFQLSYAPFVAQSAPPLFKNQSLKELTSKDSDKIHNRSQIKLSPSLFGMGESPLPAIQNRKQIIPLNKYSTLKIINEQIRQNIIVQQPHQTSQQNHSSQRILQKRSKIIESSISVKDDPFRQISSHPIAPFSPYHNKFSVVPSQPNRMQIKQRLQTIQLSPFVKKQQASNYQIKNNIQTIPQISRNTNLFKEQSSTKPTGYSFKLKGLLGTGLGPFIKNSVLGQVKQQDYQRPAITKQIATSGLKIGQVQTFAIAKTDKIQTDSAVDSGQKFIIRQQRQQNTQIVKQTQKNLNYPHQLLSRSQSVSTRINVPNLQKSGIQEKLISQPSLGRQIIPLSQPRLNLSIMTKNNLPADLALLQDSKPIDNQQKRRQIQTYFQLQTKQQKGQLEKQKVTDQTNKISQLNKTIVPNQFSQYALQNSSVFVKLSSYQPHSNQQSQIKKPTTIIDIPGNKVGQSQICPVKTVSRLKMIALKNIISCQNLTKQQGQKSMTSLVGKVEPFKQSEFQKKIQPSQEKSIITISEMPLSNPFKNSQAQLQPKLQNRSSSPFRNFTAPPQPQQINTKQKQKLTVTTNYQQKTKLCSQANKPFSKPFFNPVVKINPFQQHKLQQAYPFINNTNQRHNEFELASQTQKIIRPVQYNGEMLTKKQATPFIGKQSPFAKIKILGKVQIAAQNKSQYKKQQQPNKSKNQRNILQTKPQQKIQNKQQFHSWQKNKSKQQKHQIWHFNNLTKQQGRQQDSQQGRQQVKPLVFEEAKTQLFLPHAQSIVRQKSPPCKPEQQVFNLPIRKSINHIPSESQSQQVNTGNVFKEINNQTAGNFEPNIFPYIRKISLTAGKIVQGQIHHNSQALSEKQRKQVINKNKQGQSSTPNPDCITTINNNEQLPIKPQEKPIQLMHDQLQNKRSFVAAEAGTVTVLPLLEKIEGSESSKSWRVSQVELEALESEEFRSLLQLVHCQETE